MVPLRFARKSKATLLNAEQHLFKREILLWAKPQLYARRQPKPSSLSCTHKGLKLIYDTSLASTVSPGCLFKQMNGLVFLLALGLRRGTQFFRISK